MISKMSTRKSTTMHLKRTYSPEDFTNDCMVSGNVPPARTLLTVGGNAPPEFLFHISLQKLDNAKDFW